MSDDGVVIPLRGSDDQGHRSRHPSAHGNRAPADSDDTARTDGSADTDDNAAVYDLGVAPVAEQPVAPRSAGWQGAVAEGLAYLRRRLEGDVELDRFGFDPDFADTVAVPALRLVYDRWFRVEVNGIEHVPDTGGALLVANHAGGLAPWDAAMTAMAVHLEHPRARFLRPLAADLLFRTPGAGVLARRAGATLACHDDADRLLRDGELVGVWPEGFGGIGKNYRDRYRLQRFGRGGFVRSAIRAGVPIVPVSIIGSEEIHPVLGNAAGLARVLGLPYFPITPTFPALGPLGLVPLPSKWYLEFGTPIRTDTMPTSAADDAVATFEVVDEVRDAIQATLHRLLGQRRSIWR